LKVELRDQNQVDLNGAYITAYNHEAKQPESNEPYITGYGKHEAKQPNYITGYRTHNHKSNGDQNQVDSNGAYITAYNHEAKQPESNEPYMTGYGKHEAKQSNYITGYKTHNHESNGPYITQYRITQYGKHKTKQSNYITGYRTHNHKSNGAYITSYDKHEGKQPNYITGYKYDVIDPKGPPSTNSVEDLPISNLDHTEAFKTGYFSLDDLHVGNVMTLQFPVQEVSPYLSKKEADSIPFSMSQLPSILQLFSIPEGSPQAKSMRGALEECEGETVTGETKTCANSLESMLEFVDTIIGSNVKYSILTTSNPSPRTIPLQNYTVLEVSHDIDVPKWVACHPLPYPYAIYYCHYIATKTKVFKVSLVSDENGDKMEALGVCHFDTSEWNPNHIIFRQLGIKAGKNSPVCHFFPVNHLMWIPM
jgi:hypothetical protein